MVRAFLMILFTALLSQEAQAGFVVGNGGDSVRCEPAPGSPFAGLHALDFLLTQGSQDRVVAVAGWEESAARLRRVFAAEPDLAFLFDDFIAGMNNHDNPSERRIWRGSTYGLADLADERMVRTLPPNCRGPILQSVVQIQRLDAIEYEFDADILAEQRTSAPLQFSFLMVHELLWELTDDVQVIRNVNRFVHGARADTLPPAEVRLALLRMGLDLRPRRTPSFCDRSAPVRQFLASLFPEVPCEELNRERLASRMNQSRLSLAPAPVEGAAVPYFRPDEFVGFPPRLDGLNLTGLGLRHLFRHQFAPFSFTDRLDLSHNLLRDLSHLDLQTVATGQLNLSHNQLEKVSASVFGTRGAERLEGRDRIDLSHNALAILEPLPPIRRGSVLDLSFNRLTDLPASYCWDEVILTGNPMDDARRQEIEARCPFARFQF